MRMYINEHLKILVFLTGREFLFHLLTKNFDFKRSLPITFRIIIGEEMSVHVFTLQVVSVVSTNNSIWVNDWNEPNLVEFSKFMANYFF